MSLVIFFSLFVLCSLFLSLLCFLWFSTVTASQLMVVHPGVFLFTFSSVLFLEELPCVFFFFLFFQSDQKGTIVFTITCVCVYICCVCDCVRVSLSLVCCFFFFVLAYKFIQRVTVAQTDEFRGRFRLLRVVLEPCRLRVQIRDTRGVTSSFRLHGEQLSVHSEDFRLRIVRGRGLKCQLHAGLCVTPFHFTLGLLQHRGLGRDRITRGAHKEANTEIDNTSMSE